MTKSNMLIVSILVLAGAITLSSFKTSSPARVEYEWKQVTVIESIVLAGLGRSRMITTDSDGKLQEEKLENFFSVSGINFENVKSNDLKITDQVTQLSNNGWELYDVTTGVAVQGRNNSDGIFMTRYLFRKSK